MRHFTASDTSFAHGRFFARDMSVLPDFRFEWSLGRRATFCHLGVSLGDYENALQFQAALPRLFSFFLTFEFRPPRWWPKDEREIDVAVHGGCLWWTFWCSTWEYDSRTPKWRRGSWSPADTFLGRQQYASRTIEERGVVVPMPEASYPAKATLFESTWKRPRWPWPQKLMRVTIDMEKGIPKPGKGENSWDCGPDALHGITCPARTIEEAIGECVASALRDRKRYGGSHTAIE